MKLFSFCSSEGEGIAPLFSVQCCARLFTALHNKIHTLLKATRASIINQQFNNSPVHHNSADNFITFLHHCSIAGSVSLCTSAHTPRNYSSFKPTHVLVKQLALNVG